MHATRKLLISSALMTFVAGLSPAAGAQNGALTNNYSSAGGELLRSAPTVSVLPTSGGVGTTVTIGGNLTALAGMDPEDILCVSARNLEVEDEQFLWGVGTSVSSSSAQVTIGGIYPFPEAAPLTLKVGSGDYLNVPSLNGTVFYDPVFAWSAPKNGASIETTHQFSPNGNIVSLPCGLPPLTVREPFTLGTDGCLRAKLPGSGVVVGDILGAELFFETDSLSIGTTPTSTEMTADSPWVVANSLIVWPIVNALAAKSANCSVVYDAVTNEIVICPLPGTTIDSVSDLSALTIKLKEEEHTLFTAQLGDRDGFSHSSLDAPFPSLDFESWAPWTDPRRDYDTDGGCDSRLIDTFFPFSFGNVSGNFGERTADGEIRSAVVEIRIKGAGCQTDTDHIQFGWDGDFSSTGMLWSNRLENLADLDYSWEPGDDATLCFDLCRLPRSSGKLASILDSVAERDQLDLVIDDDTYVDYVEIKVYRANP